MISICHCTCNDQTNPLGIDALPPRFSWQLQSNERDQSQSAYRILVASSLELLQQQVGDLWDTGRVEAAQSVQVRYAGRALASRQRCFWQVKAWDQQGQEAQWSEPAWFETALLRPEDWRGQWIAHPEASWAETRPAPFFRKVINLAAVRRARVYLCGLGYHELYINGVRVGDAVLSPAFTRYDRRALYLTYDVTALLNPGENVFGVILGNGFYNQAARDAWYFEKSPWRASPRLLFQAHVEQEGGGELALVSDASWKTVEGPILFDGTRLGETYDARLELPGWNAPGYDDSSWFPARTVEAPRGRLVAQSLPPTRVTRTLRPVKLWQTRAGAAVFDLGQNIAGWACLRVSGPAGTQITLRYGELLTPDGEVDQSNINSLVYPEQGEVQVDRYILKGDGVELYEPRFSYHGFQYVEVAGAPGQLTLDDLLGCLVHTAFSRAGSFTCSSETVNRLQACTEWSYVNNFVGYPTDCPQREKNGWTGDAHLAAEAGLYNFHAETAYWKWLDDLADEQREDGALPGIVPTSGWGYDWGNGPCWDSAAILIPWYIYLYRGDQAILERCYPMIRRYLEYLAEKSGGGGLLSLGLGDWVPPYGRPEDYTAPLTLLSSAYYYMDVQIGSQVARLLGFAQDASRYAELAEKLSQRFNALFYDSISGLYAGGSQTAQGMALYAGLAQPEERPRAVRQLVAEIRQQKGRINAGIHGAKAVLNALAENGFHAQAYHLITQPQYPGWTWWLTQGATTLWETWDGAASRNHIMFGDISAWFYKYLAGIRPDPDQPGFKRVLIRPYLAEGLEWVRAEHHCPYGAIRSAWQRHGERFQMEITLPANTTGWVYLPRLRPGSVRVDGATLEAAGLQFVTQRTGGMVIQVGSGTRRFECALSLGRV
jgi:alpha-L-rhamnosidase